MYSTFSISLCSILHKYYGNLVAKHLQCVMSTYNEADPTTTVPSSAHPDAIGYEVECASNPNLTRSFVTASPQATPTGGQKLPLPPCTTIPHLSAQSATRYNSMASCCSCSNNSYNNKHRSKNSAWTKERGSIITRIGKQLLLLVYKATSESTVDNR